MKNIIKLTCLLLTVCGFAGCTGNFDEYNTDPYALYKGDPAVLIPTMLDAMMYVQQNDSQMVDQMVGSLGGYFTLSNRWGGQNFDTFNASDAWNATPYNTMFEDIYANFFDIEKSTSKSGHYYAMARLVRAAVMMRVADCYGPIPYSKVVLCRVRLGGGCLQAYHRGPRGRGDHALRLCAGVSGVETAG